jgi:hypothetical protein
LAAAQYIDVRCPDLPRVLYGFSMSASPPKADMCGAPMDVHFGPKADKRGCGQIVR